MTMKERLDRLTEIIYRGLSSVFGDKWVIAAMCAGCSAVALNLAVLQGSIVSDALIFAAGLAAAAGVLRAGYVLWRLCTGRPIVPVAPWVSEQQELLDGFVILLFMLALIALGIGIFL